MATGLKRDTRDKFYTKEAVAMECVALASEHLGIGENDMVVEPSAGNGAFISAIKQLCSNYRFYDLFPENTAIIQQDYLRLNTHEFTGHLRIHIIGNPPFGRQSSLAIRFIKKSVEYADTVSFILPRSFKKDSMRKHFPRRFHLLFENDLPDNSFTVNGEDHDVPCVFQIWEKRDTDREMPQKLEPQGYKFVKKNEPHDIAFRRVGVFAGAIFRETSEKSEQSHYFIKFENDLSESMFHELKSIDYQCKNNTVGARSISKQELIKEYNMVIERD